MATVAESFRSVFKRLFARPEAPHESPYQGRWAFQSVGNSVVAGHDSFDNVFPYVNAISNRFASVIPYAVDAYGERLDTPPALQALYNPNDMFSCREFLAYLASSMLVNSHTDILIWTLEGPGENITPDNITGYTFLPSDARVYLTGGDWYYQTELTVEGVQRMYTFTREQVISLTYARHPSDPAIGVAPAMTITKWANVDDMLADYERGFFGNGTVPAGMIEIVAESADDFEATKRQIEQRFRGAKNHNSVVYNYRPADPVTHDTVGESKLTWVPFTQSNDSLDIGTLNDIVNNRLANALAVPDIVRGIDNGQTYANAEQAQRTFIENTLQPLCLNVWDKWQFELDRITGGLGYGITFDLDLPAQTDVEHTRAETQSTQVDNLLKLIEAGVSLNSAVDALDLPDEYKRLEFVDSPSESVSEPVLTLKKNFAKPDGLSEEESRVYDDAYREAVNQYDVFASHLLAGEYVNVTDYAEEFAETMLGLFQWWVVWCAYHAGDEIVDGSEDDFIIPFIRAYGEDNLRSDYTWDTLPSRYADLLRDHLQQVGESSFTTLQTRILSLMKQAQSEGWSDEELQRKVSEYIRNVRASAVAITETEYAGNAGRQYAADSIGEALHLRIVKTWHTTVDDRTCEFCRSMDGYSVTADRVFLRLDETRDVDGGVYVNDYADMDTPPAHPNCRCSVSYRFERVDV